MNAINLKSVLGVSLLYVLLSSCSNSNGQTQIGNENNLQNSTEQLDTSLSKYCGYYALMLPNGNYKKTIVISRFPANTKIHTTKGDKYVALDAKYIGKYFLAYDNSSFLYETNKVTSYAGGYVAPADGFFITGVNGGSELITNWFRSGPEGISTEYLQPNPNKELYPGWGQTMKYGKFEKRADGHYDYIYNNTKYTWLREVAGMSPNMSSTTSTETFSDTAKTTGIVTYYKIQDPDGYSNLRDWPNGKILQKVYPTEKLEIIGTEGDYKQVKLQNGKTGYIHSSRLVKIE